MLAAQLAWYAPERRTSFISVLAGVARAAAGRGWEPVILLPEEARGRTWAGELEDVARIGYCPGTRGEVGWVAEQLAGAAPRVLHTHFTGFDLAALAAERRLQDSAVIWHFHTVLSRRPDLVARNAFKLSVLGRRVGAFGCPSDAIAAQLRARGAARGKIEVLPTPVDAAAFPLTGPAERAEARRRLSLPADATILLHFGWDWKLKGGDLFLATVRELRAEIPGLIGLTRAAPEAAERIRRAGLGDAVRVQEPVDDAAELYAAADLLVASSRAEGMPFTVAESLLTGTPVVATDLPGHRYLGHLPACRVRAATPVELAAAARGLLSRPPAEARLEAEESRRWIQGELSVAGYGRRLADLYAALAGG